MRRYSTIVSALTLAFFVVYAHGMAVIWCIYLYEKEDIVIHYCQHLDPTTCDGTQYVLSVLEGSSHKESSPLAPKPPATLQELRAVATNRVLNPTPNHSSRDALVWLVCAVPLRGVAQSVFHPPKAPSPLA